MAAPTFPPLTGRIVDNAHILSPEQTQAIEQKLIAHEQTSSDQVVVVTLPSLEGLEVEDYGYQLGRAWGIGQKNIDNGVLLIVAPAEHKVRIEVGYGLEGVFTDMLAGQIVRHAIVPKFKAGDMPGGIVAGVDGILEVLNASPEELAARKAEADAAAPAANGDGSDQWVFWVIVIIFIIIFISSNSGGGGGRRSRRGGMPMVIFGPSLGGNDWSGGSGWSGGGGFGGGGGGFGGGGGGFGGGGASGGW